MKIIIAIIIAVGIIAGVFLYQKVMVYQAIRDKCYATGIKYMPPTTDLSMMAGVPEYQACIQKGGKYGQ